MTIAYVAGLHCGGKTRAGTPCRQRKGHRTGHPGIGHCSKHGGNTRNGVAHAKTEAAEMAVARLGVPRGNGDPFALLAKTVQHADGFLEASAQVVVDAGTEGAKATAAIDLQAAIAIYEQAIRTAFRTAKAAVDADVADRLAAIDERASGLLMRFVTELLERTVPKAKRREVETWAAARLEELSAEYERPGAVH